MGKIINVLSKDSNLKLTEPYAVTEGFYLKLLFKVFLRKSGYCSLHESTPSSRPLLRLLSPVRVLQKSWIILIALSQLSFTTLAVLTQSLASQKSGFSHQLEGSNFNQSADTPSTWNMVQLLSPIKDTKLALSSRVGGFGFSTLKLSGFGQPSWTSHPHSVCWRTKT